LLLLDPVLYERMLSIFTKVDTSTEMRLAFWESTIAMIQDHPFLGIGWGAFYLVYPEYDFYMQGAPILIVHAHNMYLNYAAEIGLPGALAFFWFFFGSIYLACRAKFSMPKPHLVITPFTLREDGADKELADISATIEASMPQPARRFWHEIFDVEEWRLLSGLSLGLALAFISIALNGLTDHLLFNIPSSMFFWLLAALAAAVFLMQEDEEDIVEAEENKATLLEVVKAKFEATLEDVRQAKPEAKLEEILNLKPEAAPEAKPEAEADEKKEPEQEKEVQPKEEEESPKAEAELEEKLKLFEKMKKPEDRKEGAADHEEGKD
jgi:putative inorganic carbon (HCO3(-)) transporter